MLIVEPSLLDLAAEVLRVCRAQHLRLATAESCTGGLIAGCLTAVAGSSIVFDRGFVTYSNVAKTAELGVSAELLAKRGAVDEAVARAMAEGALAAAGADVSVAVTGIAGPDGGGPGKPVGLVHFAAARSGAETLHERHVFAGDRQQVRAATVETALRLLARRVASVVKWSQRKRRTGALRPRRWVGGNRPLRLAGARAWLLERLATQPDLTLRAIQGELAGSRHAGEPEGDLELPSGGAADVQKKACTPPSRTAPTWRAGGRNGRSIRAGLTPDVWSSSTRPGRRPT